MERLPSFVRQHIDQTSADHDGVPYRKSFDGRGKQHPAVRLHVQLGRNDEVVDHRDVVAALEQTLAEDRSEVAGPAGHQNVSWNDAPPSAGRWRASI